MNTSAKPETFPRQLQAGLCCTAAVRLLSPQRYRLHAAVPGGAGAPKLLCSPPPRPFRTHTHAHHTTINTRCASGDSCSPPSLGQGCAMAGLRLSAFPLALESATPNAGEMQADPPKPSVLVEAPAHAAPGHVCTTDARGRFVGSVTCHCPVAELFLLAPLRGHTYSRYRPRSCPRGSPPDGTSGTRS